MSTAPWHEPPTTIPGPSETLIKEVCAGIAIAGIDRERRSVRGLFLRALRGRARANAYSRAQLWAWGRHGGRPARLDRKSPCPVAETARQRQEPSGMCICPRGVRSYRRAGGSSDQERLERIVAICPAAYNHDRLRFDSSASTI